MFTFTGAPNPTPTLNLPTSEQSKTHRDKYKCSHGYLFQTYFSELSTTFQLILSGLVHNMLFYPCF